MSTIPYDVLLNGSRLSFEDSINESSSAIHGPGALSAKALIAFGNAILRSIEPLYLHAKLRKLRSKFRKFEDRQFPGLDKMFAEILELARVGCYGPRLRKPALRILLMQIHLGYTSFLVKHLSNWPIVEISLFLRELILCMPYDWTELGIPRKKMHVELRDFYVHIRDVPTPRPSKPLLQFLSQLVRSGERGRDAFINVGGLDLVLRVYLNGRLLGLGGWPTYCARNCLPTPWTECMDLLALHPQAFGHPLLTLFPRDNMMAPLDDAIRLRGRDRWDMWRGMPISYAWTRVISLAEIVRSIDANHLTYLWDTDRPCTPMFDFYLDLLEFLHFDTYGFAIAQVSLGILLFLLDHAGQLPSSDPDATYANLPRTTINNEHIASERAPFPFTVRDPYEQIVEGLWLIVKRFPSISIQRELPTWAAVYPYHLKYPLPPHASFAPQGRTPLHMRRFSRAKEAATILAIPLAIIRQEHGYGPQDNNTSFAPVGDRQRERATSANFDPPSTSASVCLVRDMTQFSQSPHTEPQVGGTATVHPLSSAGGGDEPVETTVMRPSVYMATSHWFFAVFLVIFKFLAFTNETPDVSG